MAPVRDSVRAGGACCCTVFSAIQRRRPRDWTRLCDLGQRVCWLTGTEGRSLGRWCVDPEHLEMLRIERQQNLRASAYEGSEEFRARGWIGLSRGATQLPPAHCVPLSRMSADTLSRVAATSRREKPCSVTRSGPPKERDMYAFRWGFEQQVRAAQSSMASEVPGQALERRTDLRFFGSSARLSVRRGCFVNQ
jgi:hypothetical protein